MKKITLKKRELELNARTINKKIIDIFETVIVSNMKLGKATIRKRIMVFIFESNE
tara:strand:- start:113 stop:277 length:165 start_codon:yes stop_codon:yes gene_type:complete